MSSKIPKQTYIWSNSDVKKVDPFPLVADEWKSPEITGKSRLVKYYPRIHVTGIPI